MATNIQDPPNHSAPAKPKPNTIGVAPILPELARMENAEVFAKLKTSLDGLSLAAAEARLAEYGPNAVAMEKQRGWAWRLFRAARNLLVVLLAHPGRRLVRNGGFDRGHRHGADVDPWRGFAVCSGVASGCGGGKTQSDDQRDCGGRAGGPGKGDPAQRVGSRGYCEVVRRRHGPRGCAIGCIEGPLRSPSLR